MFHALEIKDLIEEEIDRRYYKDNVVTNEYENDYLDDNDLEAEAELVF